jgi:hypothetical protein
MPRRPRWERFIDPHCLARPTKSKMRAEFAVSFAKTRTPPSFRRHLALEDAMPRKDWTPFFRRATRAAYA